MRHLKKIHQRKTLFEYLDVAMDEELLLYCLSLFELVFILLKTKGALMNTSWEYQWGYIWKIKHEYAGSALRGREGQLCCALGAVSPCPCFSSASDHSLWVSLISSCCSPRLSRSGIPQISVWPLFFLLYTLPRLSPTIGWKLKNHYFQLYNMFILTLTGGHRHLSVSTGRAVWVVYLYNL